MHYPEQGLSKLLLRMIMQWNRNLLSLLRRIRPHGLYGELILL